MSIAHRLFHRRHAAPNTSPTLAHDDLSNPAITPEFLRPANDDIPIDVASAHAQKQSPFFSTIPPEIRNHIFWLALQAYDDPNKPYARDTYYTRPGCMGKPRVDTELLRTCKKVYAETNVIPLRDLEIESHLGDCRRAAPGTDSWSTRLRNKSAITAHQMATMSHVRLTAQLYALQPYGVKAAFRVRGGNVGAYLSPSVVTISIRYTDWWHWESNTPLSIDSRSFRNIKFPASVKKVVMELETRDSSDKVKQLDAIIAGFFKDPESCKYGREDGKEFLVNERKGVREWTWEGPTSFGGGDGQVFEHHPKSETMGYVVKVVVWDAGGEEDKGRVLSLQERSGVTEDTVC